MTATSEEMLSGRYTHYKGSAEPVEGNVEILQRMQNDPDYVKWAVAKQLAGELKQQGKSVWLDGCPVGASASNVDKSSCEMIHVIADSCGRFDLECYTVGSPIRLVHDN